jgi:hypothetical protein
MTVNNTVMAMAGFFIMGSLLLSGISFNEPNWLWKQSEAYPQIIGTIYSFYF